MIIFILRNNNKTNNNNMTSKLKIIRSLYKVNRNYPNNVNAIFKEVKNIYNPGDYKEFYKKNTGAMYDVVFNDYDLYRVHLSILEPGGYEKSNLSRQICMLEGKIHIEDKFCNINLYQGCYLSKTKNIVKNNELERCVFISHIDIKNNLQDLPLL